MTSDSAKIPYGLNYDISPILGSKFNPFNENTLLHNQFHRFSPEKNKYTPEFKTAESSNSPFSFRRAYNEDRSAFETNKVSLASKKPNQIVFSSQIFSSVKSVPVTVIHKRSSIRKLIKKSKEEPLVPISINEILINGSQLRNYPFISISEEEAQVFLPQTLIEKRNLFSVSRSSSPFGSYSQRCYCFPGDKLEKIELTTSQLSLNNIGNYIPNETNPIQIIRKFYGDIKNLLLLLDKYYSSRKPRIYSEKAVLEIERLINQCNAFTDYLRKVYVVLSQNFIVSKANGNESCNHHSHSLSLRKKNGSFPFKCSYCRKKFSNGQSLGGHISQCHPKQSLKYKRKIEIRNNRVNQRKQIIESRKELFSRYNYDYEALKMDKGSKEIIRQLISKHRTEYKKIILKKKREHLEQCTA